MAHSKARTVFFGELRITENVSEDLLSNEEREVYSQGFALLKAMIEVASEVELLVLLKPSIMSAIVGLQSFTSISFRGELKTIYHVCKKAGIAIEDHFICLLDTADPEHWHSKEKLSKSENYNTPPVSAFLDIQLLDYYQSIVLLHIASMRWVMQKYSKLLYITDTQHISKETIAQHYIKRINGRRYKVYDMSNGLYSNFPLDDIREFIKHGVYEPEYIYPLGNYHVLDTDDAFWHDETYPPKLFMDPIQDLYSMYYSRNNMYYPLLHEKYIFEGITVAGLGIQWRSFLPTSPNVVRHCQMLMQVDRELGLTAYLEQKLATIKPAEIIKDIRKYRSEKH